MHVLVILNFHILKIHVNSIFLSLELNYSFFLFVMMYLPNHHVFHHIQCI